MTKTVPVSDLLWNLFSPKPQCSFWVFCDHKEHCNLRENSLQDILSQTFSDHTFPNWIFSCSWCVLFEATTSSSLQNICSHVHICPDQHMCCASLASLLSSTGLKVIMWCSNGDLITVFTKGWFPYSTLSLTKRTSTHRHCTFHFWQPLIQFDVWPKN